MSAKFNPFHRWLGLSPKITNPHHFQLLGVSTKITNPSEIKQAVEAGVKRTLAELDKVPPGQHAELLKKLKQRIAEARSTLLDADLRQSYVENLKRQAIKQKSGQPGAIQKAPAPPQSNSANPPPQLTDRMTSDLVPPSAAAANKTPATNGSGQQKSKFTPPTIGGLPEGGPLKPTTVPAQPSSAVASSQPIPMAVPLAQPGKSNPGQGGASNERVAVNSDGVPIDEVRIQKNASNRGKKSRVGWILGLLMFGSAAAGCVLIYLNWNSILALGGVDPEVVPAAPGVVIEKEEKQKEPDNAPPSIPAASNPDRPLVASENKLPDLNFDEIPELDVDAVKNDPETAIVTGRNANQQKRMDEANRKRLEAEGVVDLPDPNDGPLNDSDESTEEPPEPSGEIVQLDELQLARFRRHIERARRCLYRREKSAALSSIDLAKKILAEVQTEPNAQFAGQQASIAALADETEEIYDLIDGFWNQVVESCQTIPGGQEIVASGQTIGFVESDSEKFIVRHAGANVTYEYHFCPPSLAVALAKQGAVPDVPTWNKQLAAFYVLNQDDEKDDQSQIDDLLKVAEENGHDCSGIRHFASFQFGEIGIPADKIEFPETNTVGQAIQELRAQYDYKAINQLSSGKARMLAELLLQIDSPNFEQHVELLEEARKLAIRSGEAGLVQDAIVELANFAIVDQVSLTGDSYLELINGDLTPGQSRSLLELAIPFLKSSRENSKDAQFQQELFDGLTRIAKSHDMTDALRRLNQMGQD